MALADYIDDVSWFWFADDLTDIDIPEGNGATKSNQSGLSDPAIAGAGDTYADFTLIEGVMFTPPSPLGNVGTGDVTIFVKLLMDTSTAGRCIFQNYDGAGTEDTDTGWSLFNTTGTSRRIGLVATPTLYTAEVTDIPSSFHTNAAPVTLAWRRVSGTWTVWGNAISSGGLSEVTPVSNSFGGGTVIGACGDLSFGAQRTGANPADIRIYWIGQINTGVLDADLALADWADEANLKTAWLTPAAVEFLLPMTFPLLNTNLRR